MESHEHHGKEQCGKYEAAEDVHNAVRGIDDEAEHGDKSVGSKTGKRHDQEYEDCA